MFTRTVIEQPQLNRFLFGTASKKGESGIEFAVVLLCHNLCLLLLIAD